MAEIEKLGSLYFDGHLQEVGVACNCEQISLGDTVPGQEISWVRLKNGLLIADRCICTNISWKQLNEFSFVFGSIVDIDGKKYMCRCPKVGAYKSGPNEWDAALDEAGESNKFWHWEEMFFWGQETPTDLASGRAVRGSPSARYWHHYNAASRNAGVGFRPVLEFLGSDPCSPDTLVGKTIKAYCPDGVTIEGYLVDYTDYDVMLRANSSLPVNSPWAVKKGRNVIVNRENINWLKEM